MVVLSSLLIATSALSAYAAPASELAKRLDTASHCGDWDTIAAGSYSLLNNHWGTSGASGSQCASLTSLSGTTVAWKTTWNWSGTNNIKSYTNIQLNQGLNKKLSAISSMKSTWKWSQSTSSGVVGDVAYDLFTSSTVGGANVHEIMIWLANYNAGPISYNYGADGKPVAIASNLSIAGKTWNLYNRSNGANQVWSFLPTSGTITSFSGDINLFLKYLTSNSKISSSQYLKTAQAGTEPTSSTKAVTLTTSAYSLVIA